MTRFALTINRRHAVVDVPSDTPLLDVLRDELGLLGAKYGCGEGQCGACCVLVDGESAPSCTLPIAAVGSRPITTIEGLTGAVASEIQDAFIAEGAMQCGYCTSGLVIAAAALLARTPSPGDDDIRAALDGHLCRCGVYGRVISAVRRAAGAPR
ncbi:MAG TPA: (2Fe-2S)-binding protein [Kofleriaceae bacterium]|nr:(2Fe-2S)-binding protein [Kofleriaceae bacterium]